MGKEYNENNLGSGNLVILTQKFTFEMAGM
jgi:hypothetical protein